MILHLLDASAAARFFLASVGALVFSYFSLIFLFAFSQSIVFYNACSSTPPAVLTTPQPRAAHNCATDSVRTRRREPRASARWVTHPHPPPARPGATHLPSAARGVGRSPHVCRPAPAPPVAASGYRPWRSPYRFRGSPRRARSMCTCPRGTKNYIAFTSMIPVHMAHSPSSSISQS